MKNRAGRIIPLAAIAILLISVSPLAFASTLTVNLNPSTGLAQVDSVSTTSMVFTYPENSTASNYLRNVSTSFSVNGTFGGSSDGILALQDVFHHDGSHVSVENASVSYDYSAVGNATTLVIHKTTNITAWVSGVFEVVNGTVQADLGWRSFVVPGPLDFHLGDQMMDVNLVGPTMQYSLGQHPMEEGFLLGAFGEWGIWNRPTLNYSALNTPLSTWTRNYDSSTNTTTFSKTVTGSFNFSSSFDYNGQVYSFSETSDPSGVISVQGYASASGDSLVIQPPPASSSGSILAVGATVAILAALGGYLAIKHGIGRKTPLAY